MPGRDLGSTFSSLRPNDLVWNYVQSNYLKGNEPPAFDLLYWNGTARACPAHVLLVSAQHLPENSLKTGKLTVAGEQVDLAASTRPPSSTVRAKTISCPGRGLRQHGRAEPEKARPTASCWAPRATSPA
jgi:hypothetical protein